MTDEPRNTARAQTSHTLVGSSAFPTTRWTLVVAAADPRRQDARAALVSLCEGYWYPIYAYVRRRGYPADQAQDLTQEFFIRADGRPISRSCRPGKGTVPSVHPDLLEILPRRRRRSRSRAETRRREAVLSFEISSGEDRYQREPAHNETPERIFERRWALSVLDRVVDRLRAEFVNMDVWTISTG